MLFQDLETYIENSTAESLNYNDEDEPYIEDRNQAEYFVKLYHHDFKNLGKIFRRTQTIDAEKNFGTFATGIRNEMRQAFCEIKFNVAEGIWVTT